MAVHINVGQPRTSIVASTLQLDDELLVLKGRRLRIKAWLLIAGMETTCRHASAWWQWQICVYAGI